jgi:DHA2 family multidrug resistance protein
MGYNATWAGLVAAPSGAVAVLATPFVSKLKLDARLTATLAFLCLGGSFWMRSHYTPDASFVALAAPLALQGLGLSIFFVPLLTILLDGIEPDRVPSASGLSNFARIITGSFAASLITTYWDRREALHQERLVEQANGWSPLYGQAVDQLQSTGMSSLQAAGSVYRQVIGQSYLLSSLELFWISAIMAVAMIGVVWLCRRPAPSDHIVAAD